MTYFTDNPLERLMVQVPEPPRREYDAPAACMSGQVEAMLHTKRVPRTPSSDAGCSWDDSTVRTPKKASEGNSQC